MTVPQVTRSYTVATGSSNNDVSVPFITTRAPTVYDINYPQGKLWINESTNLSYVLTSFTALAGVVTANWTITAGGSGLISTLTGDSGGAISPSLGNINLLGTANEITTTGSGSTITWSIPSTFIAPGSIAATTTLTATLGNITATNGNLVLSHAGNKISIATGSNASVGTSGAMTAGAVTVANTSVTASSKIFAYPAALGTVAAPQAYYISAIVAATSFTITSADATDTSTWNYWIIN